MVLPGPPGALPLLVAVDTKEVSAGAKRGQIPGVRFNKTARCTVAALHANCIGNPPTVAVAFPPSAPPA
jgi:hypothetical protein